MRSLPDRKGSKQAVSDLAQQFGSEQILGLVGDCADANSLSERVSELEKAWGGLDGVVANVGDGRSVPTQFQMPSSGHRCGRPTLRLL